MYIFNAGDTMPKIDYNALGQAIDTSWGRTSTPKTASYSVKFTLAGDVLVASYQAIVNFASEKEMILMKRMYESESQDVIAEVLKNVKAVYKDLSGNTLTTKEYNSSTSVEIIGFNVHNPKRTAYIRRKTSFEIA
jgi:hypothetical protein